MWFVDLLIAAAIAVVIAVIFIVFLKKAGPWGSFWTFFIILFLGVLAASVWVRPVGPDLWGFYWVPGLLTGLIIAFLLAAAGSVASPPGGSDADDNKVNEYQKSQYQDDKPGYNPRDADPKRPYFQGEGRRSVIMGAFFWILLLFLLLIAILGLTG